MKTKKGLLFAVMAIFLMFVFVSCPNVSGPDLNNGTENGINKGKLLTFNMKSLTGLAIAEQKETRGNSRSETSEGMLVKILEDGSIENFINVPENANLSKVSFVTQSPAESAKEIYIVFEGRSWWDEYDSVSDTWNYYELGQLLCVYEDGTYVDVLATDDDSNKWLNTGGNDDSPIKFDDLGNMYYQVWEGSGNSSTGMIYKFDPKKGVSKQLTPPIPNTNYQKFYVSKDGNWIFAHANRWESNNNSTNYLRAIPVSDASNPVNLFYDSTGSNWLNQWIYDDESKNVYFTVAGGLYKVPYKNGTYSLEDKELLLGGNNSREYLWWNTLFTEPGEIISEVSFIGATERWCIENGEGITKKFYFIDPTDGETINYDEIVKYMFASLLSYLKEESYRTDSYDEEGYWLESKYVDFSETYEIRFDEFENVKGFEKLATETKDADGNSLKNEALFEALVEKDLLNLFCRLLNNRYEQNKFKTYDYNLFADILYNKETGEKISKDLFRTDDYGYYESGFYFWHLFSEDDSYWLKEWKKEFLDESGELLPEKVLAKLAACCGKTEIDFSLEYFLDNSEYGELYTTLKNEDAIKFLDTDKKRVLLSELLCNDYTRDEFLENTCFKKGTTKPAYNGNNDNYINYWNLGNFTLYEKSLYAVDTNTNKLYLFVDSEGNAVGEEIVPDYADPIRISSTLVKPEGIYIKNANINNSGDEIGSHTVLRFDPKTNSFENMFYEMPNNKTYEVISYTVGGDNLYCCLSKGTEISTIKIDINTKQFIPIASGTKLSQIIIVK